MPNSRPACRVVVQDSLECLGGQLGWRAEQEGIREQIEAHEAADRSYVDEGIKLLELSQRVAALFVTQPAREKRRLLDFVLSNSTWGTDGLNVKFRQPFDMLAVANAEHKAERAAGLDSDGPCPSWLPG